MVAATVALLLDADVDTNPPVADARTSVESDAELLVEGVADAKTSDESDAVLLVEGVADEESVLLSDVDEIEDKVATSIVDAVELVAESGMVELVDVSDDDSDDGSGAVVVLAALSVNAAAVMASTVTPVAVVDA